MAKKDSAYLLKSAIDALTADGLKFAITSECMDLSRNVRAMTEAKATKRVLIHTRSQQSTSSRFLYGVSFKVLSRIDEVIIWAENEDHYYRVPAKTLNDLYSKMVEDKTVRNGPEGWRINVDFYFHSLIPQLSDDSNRIASASQRGYSRDIERYAKPNNGVRKNSGA